uniref:Beta-1,4-galactosyltransferase 3 n=1 Tax=Catharus ustulatus TaxID=91951 RepID=A0A8C3TW48_CATUS
MLLTHLWWGYCLKEQTWVADLVGLKKGGETSLISLVLFSVSPYSWMIMERNPFVQSGGHYKPPHCFARYKSAILVVYRNQEKYLHHLLYYIHPFLQRQQLSYTIYLIQQVGTGSFNRAKLLNVGVREAMKDEEWDCLVLHNINLVPENDYNLYICDEYYPKHMASAMDKFQYTLPYKSFFGGVSALTPEHYMKINGFPNTYWGDGGENDDIATRYQRTGQESKAFSFLGSRMLFHILLPSVQGVITTCVITISASTDVDSPKRGKEFASLRNKKVLK